MQWQLQIWTELSHNDLWKSDTSRVIKNILLSTNLTKVLLWKPMKKSLVFRTSSFVIEKWIFFSPFGWLLQFLWCSLLVSDFQRSMWEYSIHICRCPWFMTGRGQIRDQNPAVFFINYQDNLWTLFCIYTFSILNTVMVPKQLHGRLFYL